VSSYRHLQRALAELGSMNRAPAIRAIVRGDAPPPTTREAMALGLRMRAFVATAMDECEGNPDARATDPA
jgi:hypothetical protein